MSNPTHKIIPKGEVFMGGKLFSVEIADTDVTRERGLSGHKPLLDNEGMIFEFKDSKIYRFWMKDMLFPLDIIWIDENLQIVHIEHSLYPETYPKTFFPPTKSLYVLEISAGQSDLLKIKTGDRVVFEKKPL